MKKAAAPVILAAVMLLAVADIAVAQQQTKIITIGWLTNSGRLRFDDLQEGAPRAWLY